MKKRFILSSVASLFALGLVACGQEQAPVEETAVPVEEPTLLEQATEAARDASDQITDMVSQAADRASETIEPMAEDAREMSDDALARAEQMIEQIKSDWSEGDEEGARSMLERLESFAADLPETIKDEIERLKAMMARD